MSAIIKNWEDPVWSKVIAGSILLVVSSVSTSLYSIFYSISIKTIILNYWNYLNVGISIRLWHLIGAIFIYSIVHSYQMLKVSKHLFSKMQGAYKDTTEVTNQKLPRAPRHSTSFFYERMSSAFPGIRDLTWFETPSTAIERLGLLLKDPIEFDPESSQFGGNPIWWFRGTSSNSISSFGKIDRNTALMDFKRLRVRRIAAYHTHVYYKDFVYVEVEGERQTGLYNLSKSDIESAVNRLGYSTEEYGVIKNFLSWKTLISREDYDDGATEIRGKVRNAQDAELRVRYLTTYNFIIAAKGSPYNSDRFTNKSNVIFNKILKNEVEPSVLFEFMETFRKNESRLV